MKSDYNKDFDNQIKKKFMEHSPEVPASLWNKIEKEIETSVPIATKLIDINSSHHKTLGSHQIDHKLNVGKARKINNPFGFKRFMGIAAVFLIIGFSIWKLQPEEKVFLKGSTELARNNTSQVPKPEPENKGNPNSFKDPEKLIKSTTYRSENNKILKSTDQETGYPEIAGIENLHKKSINESIAIEPKKNLNETTKQVDIQRNAINSAVSEHGGSSSTALAQESLMETEGLESLEQDQELALVDTDNINANGELSLMETSNSISNEEQYLLESQPKERPKIVSSVLNFLASNLQVGGDKIIEFTETENGIIKIDLKGIFNKNNQ